MKSPRKTIVQRSRFSDHTPMKFPGMFPSRFAKEKAPTCRAVLFELFTGDESEFIKIPSESIETHLSEAFLVELIDWYRIWHDQDHRISDADMKAVFSSISAASKKLSILIGNTSINEQIAFNHMLQNYRQKTKGGLPKFENFIEALKFSCDELVTSFNPIIMEKHPKRSTTRFKYASEKLAEKWVSLTGQSFVYVWTKRTPRKGKRFVTDDKEFAEDSIHFVHVVLQAIDPHVTIGEISSALR